jgi:hypothetical protein
MLAQFALVVFGIFGIMALAIDMGIVTLTRVQMQNAADAATIEGLRHRDAVIDETTDTVDAYASDCYRRVSAADVVRWTVDDDFDAGTIEVDRQLGAGPYSLFPDEAGQGNLDASRMMRLPTDRGSTSNVYKPDLQFNLADNVANGDMVSGHYDPLADYDPMHVVDESDLYERADFSISDTWSDNALPPCDREALPLGTGAVPGGQHDAFLVRLRRTDDRNAALDDIPGVSSKGGPLDLIFGRGTTVHEDPDSGYSVRRDGLTVRGTAIATTAPALRIGPPAAPLLVLAIDPLLIPGVPSALATPRAVTFESDDGTIRVDGAVIDPADPSGMAVLIADDTVLGTFIDPTTDPATLTTVGRAVPGFGVPPSCDSALPVSVVPVAGTTGRVVGFASIQIECITTTSAHFRLHVSRVASANATALIPEGLPDNPGDPNALPPSDLPLIMSAAHALAASGAGLLVPRIAR